MTGTPDPAELLERLRANDAQFDRCEIACDYTHYKKPIDEFYSYKWRTSDTSATASTPRASPEPKTPPAPLDRTTADGWSPKKSQMVIGIKWPDFAARRDYVKSEIEVDAYTKWQSIGQDMAHLSPWEHGSGGREWYLNRTKESVVLNSYQIKVVQIHFSLGVGYGKRMSEIKSITATDDGYEVEAIMDIWEDGTGSVAHLDINTDYIVRKAKIEPSIMIYTIESSGTLSGHSFKCAERGSLERAVKETRHLNIKFDVLLKDLKLGISEERFEQLADLSTPSDEKRFEKRTQAKARIRAPTEPLALSCCRRKQPRNRLNNQRACNLPSNTDRSMSARSGKTR